VRQLGRYALLVVRRWVSLTIAGLLAATLGFLDLTPLDINIPWGGVAIILLGGLTIAQYQVWLDGRTSRADSRRSQPPPERAFDLGWLKAEMLTYGKFSEMDGDSSEADIRDALKKRRDQLAPAVVAVMTEFGWSQPPEFIDTIGFDGLIETLSHDYQRLYNVGRRLGELTTSLPVYWSPAVANEGPAQRDALKVLLRKAASDLAANADAAGVAQSKAIVRFFERWTETSTQNATEEYLRDVEELREVTRRGIVER
jgi:hypothetical protein